MKIQEKLLSYCRLGMLPKVDELLNSSSRDIDITFDDGILFQTTNTPNKEKILVALVQYYEKTQLQGKENSREYISSRNKLIKILNNMDLEALSNESYNVLKPYTISEVDNGSISDDDSRKGDFDDEDSVLPREERLDNNSSNIGLSMDDLIKHTQSTSNSMLSPSELLTKSISLSRNNSTSVSSDYSAEGNQFTLEGQNNSSNSNGLVELAGIDDGIGVEQIGS